ncbi:MAG: DNA-binding domain-containing protein [Caenibius sp.]
MTLALLQQQFLHCIHDADAALPPAWQGAVERGLEIYRNNYRTALVEAMRETYPRTLRWVGEEAFDAAVAHHVIMCPPGSWTLDDAGVGFAGTVAELFVHDPEVTDLVALEWAMHRAFVAEDATPMNAPAFQSACADLSEEGWLHLRLVAQPALQVIDVGSDCIGLWRALADGQADAHADDCDRPDEPERYATVRQVIVWREGLRPVCRFGLDGEGDLLRAVLCRTSYNDICARLAGEGSPDDAAKVAGRMLGQWLGDGMLAGIDTRT